MTIRNHIFGITSSTWLKMLVAVALHTTMVGTLHAQQAVDFLTRYVKTDGNFSNTGLSWESPKGNIQDAINDLRSYMVANNITTGGRVFVAAGIYSPTESTEESGGTTLNLSFKMYSGITVYGGFDADNPEASPEQRKVMVVDTSDPAGTTGSPETGKYVKLQNPTVLSGNLNKNRTSSLEWNEQRQSYTATYPGNTYHVVTFATNGFGTDGRAKGLSDESVLDGFEIQYGYANNNDAQTRSHTAYGGGVYAVDNAVVRNCEVRYCTASRSGGAIYCDGGGRVEQSYVHTNQSLGVGILYGQGGGVMLDGKGTVEDCVIFNNLAREGGAIALTDAIDLGRNGTFDYQAIVKSTLVANNTSSSEAGGIYMDHGGVLNNVSIYNNRCNGTGVIVNGEPNGQTASLFASDFSRVYNTVIWGGTIGTKSDEGDVQYATDVTNIDRRPRFYYVGISNHDGADWTYTYKRSVFNLSDDNTGDEVSHHYLCLKAPSQQSGIIPGITDLSTFFRNYDWQPHYFSAVATAGIFLEDAPLETGVYALTGAYVETDVVGEDYSSTVTLGARTCEVEQATPATTIAYREDATVTAGETTVYTLFVDPNRGNNIDATQPDYLRAGASWDKPLNNLRSALALFQSWMDTNDSKWNPTKNKYQILVKEGTLDTSISHGHSNVRSSSIWMDNNVAVYGGFASSLTGTATNLRNPIDHPTTISGLSIVDDYRYNVANLVHFGNVTGAILDGFHLNGGNAASRVNSSNDTALEYMHVGGGIHVRNDRTMFDNGLGWGVNNVPAGLRKNMTNTVRNCVILNCGARDGAAVHISAEDGTTSTLNMENVIVHNNGTNFDPTTGNILQRANYSALANGKTHSVIYVGRGSTINMDHCDVVRNVGYGLYTENGGTADVQNSLFYANMDRELVETNDFGTSAQVMAPIKIGAAGDGATAGGAVTGSSNLFDSVGTFDAYTAGLGTRIFTYSTADVATYPAFANSTRNAGITQSGGDVTYYGSKTDFTPGNMNPAVNAASTSAAHASATSSSEWGTDIVGTNRDFGGLPDVGAVENWDATNDAHNQPAYGAVMYVRDYNTYNDAGDVTATDTNITGRDGSSWEHAINGNGLYTGNGYTNLNGLQYAVNVQSAAGRINGKNREVWVGAGIYKKNNETGDDSCFMIRDLVDVYGAFPKVGNPTKAERQALVSQYVYVAKDGEGHDLYDYHDYETILQPATTTIIAGVTRRVLGQPYEFNPKKSSSAAYTGASWDGFTLRLGVLDTKLIDRSDVSSSRNGGGGAAIYKNVTLHNCIVTNNTAMYDGAGSQKDFRAGGVYMDGGTLDACYVINNLLEGWTSGRPNQAGAAYGGGAYIYSGTVFNSVIANNRIYASYADGAGLFIENSNFFNNTIVNNKAEGTARACGGVAIWTDAARGGDGSVLNVYNSIIVNNEGIKLGKIGDKDLAVQNGGKMHLHYCLTENPTDKVNGNNEITFDICQQAVKANLSKVFHIFGDYSDRSENNFRNLDLRLLSTSPAINAGYETPTTYDKNLQSNVTYDLSTYTDMDYTDRVQDCAIDIGAYEYNGAYSITPDTETDMHVAYYYVNQNGRGTSSAENPANAACWTKLQKVLDAAGRYKYLHPDMKVIVKVAAFDGANASEGSERNVSGYHPRRSTDESNGDPRLWSIMVPRGVELWGGYKDPTNEEVTNGTAYNEEGRNVTEHPTYLIGDYNYENTTATAYHVVQFTDYIFDGDGHPYRNGDAARIANLEPSSYNAQTDGAYENAGLLTLASHTQDRAIIDGVFVTGGLANASGASVGSINENQYGGACVVPDFGHVRNCILEDNRAGEGGGAVYVKYNGVVSGTLMKYNSAAYGGAVYMEQLSGDLALEQFPEEMARLVNCTIVHNEATVAGGGIWFYNNCRVNSSVFWQNVCADQANVSGQINSRFTGTTQTYRQYPFAYSAVERVRLPGTNNISVATEEKHGVRWADALFYSIDDYSVLCNSGMPNSIYENYINDYTLVPQDFANLVRVSPETSDYVDVGARVNNTISITVPTKPEQLLLRLYVASPQDVDFDMVQKMRSCGDAIYSKIGSSFGYPMQHLEDALRYIRDARMSEAPVIGDTNGLPLKHYAANLPFEIVMSRGTFYPQSDIHGNYGYSVANTFLVPEGVTIVGGMACSNIKSPDPAGTEYEGGYRVDADGNVIDPDGNLVYFGQQRRAKSEYPDYDYKPIANTTGLDARVVLHDVDDTIEGGGEQLSNQRNRVGIYDEGSTMRGVAMRNDPLKTLLDTRAMNDNNANSIFEPWEFQNQTILSGRVINSSDAVSGVFHVITTIADEQHVGQLPMTKQDASGRDVPYNSTTLNGGAGYSYLYPGTINPAYTTSVSGTASYVMGQPVEIDGIEIQDGHAYGYSVGNVSAEHAYGYYHGGGIEVDGNWCSEANSETGELRTSYKHTGTPQSVAYRDIPLYVRNCVFRNNEAGYGGAISSNTSTQIFNCAFVQNISTSGHDGAVEYINNETGTVKEYAVEYPGDGSAIYATKQANVINSLFANNEARDPLFGGNLHNFPSLRNSTSGSIPSALYGGSGTIFGGRHSTLRILNCDFVRNQGNMFPVVYTMNPNREAPDAKDYNQLVNNIFWGNQNTNHGNFAGTVINFARRGAEKVYSTSTTAQVFPNEIPTSQAELDNEFAPTVWFSCYEEGRAFSPVYDYDLREAPYNFAEYVPVTLADYAINTYAVDPAEYRPQNCNILLSSVNTDLDGPNFASPSFSAGVNGYMASSDWSISRLNNIVDNGWGRLRQTINQTLLDDGQIKYTATFDKTADGRYDGTGAYYALHYFADDAFSTTDYKPLADRSPIGDDRYMNYAAASGSEQGMLRISTDPNPTHQQTYIDMGVYEYVHTELKPVAENEVDILWVATKENIENGDPDGSCWEQPTSDLQRAIETLLASRNGHAKEIRITDGEYSPVYTMGDDKLLTFYIATGELNAESEAPLSAPQQKDQYVKSLTISGGWAQEWKMTDPSERNTEDYPAIIRSTARAGVRPDRLNTVFHVADARQWYGVSTSSNPSKLNISDDPTQANVIPITFEGLTLINPNAVTTSDADHSIPMDAQGNYATGAGFFYADQYAADGTTLAAGPTTGDLRLAFNRNIIMGSGDPFDVSGSATPADVAAHNVPALYIGKGGGDALVYNSLFHSNYGDAMVGYNTRVVNCTFALNQGITRLYDVDDNREDGLPDDEGNTGDDPGMQLMPSHGGSAAPHKASYVTATGSMAHNSIFWRNGLAGRPATSTEVAYTSATDHTPGYCQQVSLVDKNGNDLLLPQGGNAAVTSKFTYNALTDPEHYDEGAHHELVAGRDAQENIGLSLDNSDAIYGPNFTDPDVEATTQLAFEDRDFHLMPSVRLMNTGSNDIYTAVVGVNPTTVYTTVVTFANPTPDGGYQNTIRTTTSTSYDREGKTPTVVTRETTAGWYQGDREGTYEGWEADLSDTRRVIATTIDRGAYEFQNSLTRVIYVDPVHTDGDGTTWDKPYNSLQRAIDLVAVYYNSYQEEAYVFAKAGRINENLILRDGVRIYGSIPTSYTAMATRNATIAISPSKETDGNAMEENQHQWQEDNDRLAAYERQIVNDRTGMAYPTLESRRTIINGLQNSQAQFVGTTLVDGLDIHGAMTEGVTHVSAPVIDLHSNTAKIIVRNCIVRDNMIGGEGTDDLPVVSIGDGTRVLLYDVLLQNNAGGARSAVLRLGNGAYAVNVTNVAAQGNTVGGTVTGTGRMISSINWSIGSNSPAVAPAVTTAIVPLAPDHFVNCNTTADGYPFASYLKSQSALFGTYPYIWYQLEENSRHIDLCSPADYIGADADNPLVPAELNVFIDYALDRDILGNPRRISTIQSGDVSAAVSAEHPVDRGCFETWRAGGQWLSLNPAVGAGSPAATPVAADLIATTAPVNSVIHLAAAGADPETFTSLYPAYPQEGSVVYIMPGSNLILGHVAKEEIGGQDVVTNPLYTLGENGYSFRPAYLLVKEGGSLFGQGNPVNLSYLAVERYFSNGRTAADATAIGDNAPDWSYNHLTALPFNYDYSLARSVNYAAASTSLTGAQGVTLSSTGAGAVTTANLFEYDIHDRSAWNYHFQTHNSNLWSQSGSTFVEANHGVLLMPNLVSRNDAGHYQSEASTPSEALLRFTAVSPLANSYIYTEEPRLWYKTVVLTQNDDTDSSAGGADFTEKEHMGWNCIGVPYLQGEYLTGERSAEAQAIFALSRRAVPKAVETDPGFEDDYFAVNDASDYQLHVPHTLWLYYNDTDTWSARNSWDADDVNTPYADATYIMVGEGVFTQTASYAAEEEVTFSLPLWFEPAVVPSAKRLPGLRSGGDPEEVVDDALTSYRVYSRRHTICIDGLTGDEHVSVHSVEGRLYDSVSGATGTHTVDVFPGAYVVRIDRKAFKLLVQ